MMRALHKTLREQIKKHMGEDATRDPKLEGLLQAISETYEHSDKEKALLERSIELNTKELVDNNLEIERQVQTRTEELHREHARFMASVNSLRAGFLVFDPNNNLSMINPIARKMLAEKKADESGTVPTPLESLTLSMIDMRFNAAFSLEQAIQKTVRDQEPQEYKEVPYQNYVLRFFIAPIISHDKNDDEYLGTVVLIDDITEAKILERSRDEFFSIASHELRTPLTAIRGNAAIVQQYFGEQLKDESLRQIIDDIHGSSIRLIAIVNDFLEMSRIEQGKVSFNLESFNIQEIIENVVYEAGVISKEKGLKVNMGQRTLGQLPSVIADVNRIKQILYNLVGNAIKFTESGGISISAQVSEDYVKVSVSDTGRGISPENQKLLFRKFQQAGSSLITRDSSRGTGLGLYVSKLLAEGMRCSVGLDHSEQNRGTTFYLLVPIVTPEQLSRINKRHMERIDPQTGLTQLESATS